MFKKKNSLEKDMEEIKRKLGIEAQGHEIIDQNDYMKVERWQDPPPQLKTSIYDFAKFGMILSVVVLFALGFYLDAVGKLIISLLGSAFFLPLGMVAGWLVLDPFMRAKAKRFMTKKNYGLAFLTGRGKGMVTKVKNFDNDLLWVGKDNCWHITGSEVRNLNKYDEKEVILADDIKFLSGVPCLFFDTESMKPIRFYKEKTPITPEETGSALMGYTMNQLAKGMFFKRTMELIFIVIAGLAIGAIWFSYQNNQVLNEEILPIINQIKNSVILGNNTLSVG